MAKGKFDVCDQVLECLRRLIHDDHILSSTDLRARAHYTDDNFRRLARDLPPCFKAAGHPIPKDIDEDELAGCTTVSDVCDVVGKAF